MLFDFKRYNAYSLEPLVVAANMFIAVFSSFSVAVTATLFPYMSRTATDGEKTLLLSISSKNAKYDASGVHTNAVFCPTSYMKSTVENNELPHFLNASCNDATRFCMMRASYSLSNIFVPSGNASIYAVDVASNGPTCIDESMDFFNYLAMNKSLSMHCPYVLFRFTAFTY